MANKTRGREAGLLKSFSRYISYGMPILDVISNIAKIYPEYDAELKFIHESIRKGDTMYNAMLEKRNSFHIPAIYLTGIGEETSDLDKTLLKASELVLQKNKPKKMEELLFYHSLGTLLEAGLPCLRSIRILQETSRQLKAFPYANNIKKIGDYLEGGSTLSEAIEKSGKYFPREVALKIGIAEMCGRTGEESLNISGDIQREYFMTK
ncbi:MAG: type II secretion system F family protein [Candidatus Nanoarchaeia archaeon]|nr:type II secretion system F family protein [Candidatus Nanoarchaeia archaeon]MDD5740579.1 type II secretion system F family protein [Candidatus Nanoarchaeia archaeon]